MMQRISPRKSLLSWLVVSLFVGGMVLSQADAQAGDTNPAKPAAAKKAPAEKAAKKPAKQRGRLPNFYGQIGLSDEQRDKVYGIQQQYRDQIRDLQQKLNELKDKQTAEIDAVLTPDQLKKVEELKASSARKREDSKKKSSGS